MEKLREKNILLFLVVFILLFIFVFLAVTKPTFLISINNEKVNRIYEIELNEEFSPNIEATYLKKNITDEVINIGEYDNTKVGEYKIVYQLNKFIYKMNKTVFLKVVDKEKPIITLNGKDEVYSCSIQSYQEEGYNAVDNYDGDLTDKVSIKKENGYIYYSVKDSSDNEVIVKRKIITDDVEGPVIKLINNENIYIKLGNDYIEYGANASDNCDTVVDVKIEGNVDTNKVGVYEVSYTSVDSSNNKSVVKRNVFVYNPNAASNLNGGEKGVIYLTFDDGPSSYTPKILDVLSKYGIKATFFVTNSGKDEYIKREYNEGHTVALHTASHNYKKVYSSMDDFFNDLNSVSSRVERITNEKSMIIRFPGGSSNTVSKNYSKGIMTVLTDEVLKRGYHYFDWTSSVEDAGSCAKKSSATEREDCVYNYFVKGLSKSRSNVVLMHDIKSYTADKVEDMIKYGIENGYSFDKITMETEQIHHKVNN